MSTPSRIILVVQTLAPGGAERVAVRLSNLWVAAGREVVLLLVQGGGSLARELDGRVRVHTLGYRRTALSVWSIWRFLSQYPDTPVLLFGIEVGRVAALGRILGVVRNRLVYREPSSPELNRGLHFRVAYFLLRRGADAVVAQNRTAKAALISKGFPCARVRIAPNPIVGPASPRNRERCGWRLGAVGRLVPVKGYDRLVEAMPLVLQRFPHATLSIFGAGEERDSLQRRIGGLGLSSVVRLAGYRSSAEEIWDNIDVFVMSSYFEGQPNALLEALAHRIPVVSTACGGGVAELLDDLGLAECLIPEDRFPVGLADALTRCSQLPRETWVRAFSAFDSIFSMQAALGGYDSVIGESKGA